MRAEQEPTALGERFYTKADIIRAAGIPSNITTRNRLKRQIERDIDLAPQTDSKGHTVFSPRDFTRLVEFMREPTAENGLSRTDLESAILPDGSRITAGKTLHIQQITEIVTQAREKKQTFSLGQIMNALDPTPKRSIQSKAHAKRKAIDAINKYREKIQLNGWLGNRLNPIWEG